MLHCIEFNYSVGVNLSAPTALDNMGMTLKATPLHLAAVWHNLPVIKVLTASAM